MGVGREGGSFGRSGVGNNSSNGRSSFNNQDTTNNNNNSSGFLIETYDSTSQVTGATGAPSGSARGSADFDALSRGGVTDVDDAVSKGLAEMPSEEQQLYNEATAFEGAAIISMIEREPNKEGEKEKALEITMEDGVTFTVELDSGEKRLIDLGYKQELKRVLNLFQLYSVAISSMGIFAGVVPSYIQGFLNGGPVALTWYWWISVFFVHLVGLSFSEISSSFPTAGSLYFWAAALAGPSLAPIASFFTGWLEFIGISVGLSGVAYSGVAYILSPLIYMCTGVALSEYAIFGIACAVVIISAFINLLPIIVVANVLVVSAVWQIVGAIVSIILVPLVAVQHQPASFVFGYWNDYRDITSTPSSAYSFLLAVNVGQFSLYGYDSVCHLAEETKKSDKTSPIAIMGSISTVSLLGWGLLVSATFSIQSVDKMLGWITSGDPFPNAPGSLYLQIVWTAFDSRFQNGLGAKLLAAVYYGSFFYGCVAGVLGASRVCFSLARDGGFPFSRVWRQVNKTTGVPAYAVILSISIGMAFLLPLLGTPSIFTGINSIASIGWVGAYSLPIYFRFVQRESDFCPGPFYMADYIGVAGGKVVHFVSLLWIMYTVVAFCLPITFPITSYNWPQNLNWAPVAIVSCISLLGIWWMVDARFWFKGPMGSADPEEAEAVDADVGDRVEFFES